MFEVAARMHFDAAHRLRGYAGKCERLHGHRFQVEAVIAAEELGPDGLAFDFVALKRLLGRIVGELDHSYLNDLPPFREENASSENIARFIYRCLAPDLPAPVRLSAVTVWESPECWARYTE
ncbi:MAG: 6-carboxytetrahydropterin synthase QueD [Armatimonadetes bacterium]|nr:6-carboxytetrahydropterin synthase QueD [Armatimonadota bacterium]